ncbi:DUF6114 domain-containing protein [Dictyobacter aurantiacus]|uniref:Uncharacterized protein n=1 Tax=Dictyobacter aurantiacus TaxID=1936993 RepID=A0A401ZDX0_9CHLR|nr:DUF6114 domain-containing protein [Dictyobacter aurantiacus]GCE05080.1 hypothetical protein KDAU_24090 [Dictyobacter aurantiacus]
MATKRRPNKLQVKKKATVEPVIDRIKPTSTTAVEIDDRPDLVEPEQTEQSEQVVIESNTGSRLQLWLMRRPVVGSLMVIGAGILVLWGPLALMQFAFLPGNTIWAGLLVGGALCVLGLLQLFFPAYALVTGSLAIICALVSLMAAAGGFGLGMLLGIIGGAQGVAWRNTTLTMEEYRHHREEHARRPHHKKRWRWPLRPAASHT